MRDPGKIDRPRYGFFLSWPLGGFTLTKLAPATLRGSPSSLSPSWDFAGSQDYQWSSLCWTAGSGMKDNKETTRKPEKTRGDVGPRGLGGRGHARINVPKLSNMQLIHVLLDFFDPMPKLFLENRFLRFRKSWNLGNLRNFGNRKIENLKSENLENLENFPRISKNHDFRKKKISIEKKYFFETFFVFEKYRIKCCL